jgi:hypothetical protein
MKRIFALSVVFLFLAFLVSADSSAQQRERRAARTPEVEMEADAANCPTTIDDCPAEGCGPTADFKLNQAKNRKDLPTNPKSMTLNAIRKLPQPSSWPANKNRSSLQVPGREGTPVIVKGFLLRAKKEGAESCNCGVVGLNNTDIHLVIVDNPNDIEATSVTAEMTPRVRKNGHSKWVQPQVRQFEGDFVRITGWLMLDTKHISNPLVRSTNWEVHPILKFEHCTKTKSACNAGQGWEEF